MTVDPTTWRNSRAAKRMGAGALVRDSHGRVLVVEPTYKPGWELPGGAVEADESPRAGCAREVREELGLALSIGRLLCWEWQRPEPDRSESLMFVFDGGVLTDPGTIRLPGNELASFRFVDVEDADRLLVERLARRVRASLAALAGGRLIELENGVPVTA